VSWLGLNLLQRGVTLSGDQTNIPSETTVKNSLKHLEDYVVKKRNVIVPKVTIDDDGTPDYSNYIMLGYYRNPINYIFFNESVIVCTLFSFGVNEIWQRGADYEELFTKACYLAELIKREEVLKERITKDNKEMFDGILDRMVQ
jgi:glycerol-3-phosphate O-acyltransferase